MESVAFHLVKTAWQMEAANYVDSFFFLQCRLISFYVYVEDTIFEPLLLFFKFMFPASEEKVNGLYHRLYRCQGSQEGETKKESEGAAKFAHQGVKREEEHLFLRY